MPNLFSDLANSFVNLASTLRGGWSESGNQWDDEVRYRFEQQYWQDIEVKLNALQEELANNGNDADTLTRNIQDQMQVIVEVEAELMSQNSDPFLNP